jgi:hypothetical protein
MLQPFSVALCFLFPQIKSESVAKTFIKYIYISILHIFLKIFFFLGSAKPDVGHRATFLFKKKITKFHTRKPTPKYNTNDEMK